MSKEVGEMVRSRDVVQAEGSARTEGARRATGVRADGAAAGAPTTVEALTASSHESRRPHPRVAEACRVHARWRADLGTVVGR